jgi:hypothetical protein
VIPENFSLSPANPFSHAKTFVFTPNRIIPNLSVSPCMKKTESEKGHCFSTLVPENILAAPAL